MFPVLIKIGPLTIHTYGFLFALGVLMAILLILKLAKGQNLDSKIVADFIFFTLLVGLFGAKLFLFFVEIKYYLAYPSEIKYLLTSGGTFYGGLICGALFAVWHIRRHRLDYKVIGDITVPAIALAHFFGRLGCFSAGCCWGRPAPDSILGVEFTNQYAHNHTGVPLNTSLYPTQLMEAALNLLNFIVLMVWYRRRRFNGQIFCLYIFNYSLIRFVVEYFRGDPDRQYVFGGMDQPFNSLSIPQLISIVGVSLAIILYRIFKKKGERTQQQKNKTKG